MPPIPRPSSFFGMVCPSFHNCCNATEAMIATLCGHKNVFRMTRHFSPTLHSLPLSFSCYRIFLPFFSLSNEFRNRDGRNWHHQMSCWILLFFVHVIIFFPSLSVVIPLIWYLKVFIVKMATKFHSQFFCVFLLCHRLLLFV